MKRPAFRLIPAALMFVLPGCMTYTYRQVEVRITNEQTGKALANTPITVSIKREDAMRWPAGSFATTDADGRAVIRMFTSSAGKSDLVVGSEKFIVRDLVTINGGEAEPVGESDLKVLLKPVPE